MANFSDCGKHCSDPYCKQQDWQAWEGHKLDEISCRSNVLFFESTQHVWQKRLWLTKVYAEEENSTPIWGIIANLTAPTYHTFLKAVQPRATNKSLLCSFEHVCEHQNSIKGPCTLWWDSNFQAPCGNPKLAWMDLFVAAVFLRSTCNWYGGYMWIWVESTQRWMTWSSGPLLIWRTFTTQGLWCQNHPWNDSVPSAPRGPATLWLRCVRQSVLLSTLQVQRLQPTAINSWTDCVFCAIKKAAEKLQDGWCVFWLATGWGVMILSAVWVYDVLTSWDGSHSLPPAATLGMKLTNVKVEVTRRTQARPIMALSVSSSSSCCWRCWGEPGTYWAYPTCGVITQELGIRSIGSFSNVWGVSHWLTCMEDVKAKLPYPSQTFELAVASQFSCEETQHAFN